MTEEDPGYVEMPINGTLDLHTFRPGEVKGLIHDYIDACLEKGIFQLRIIHGKGKGVLRRIVRTELEKHPAVITYRHETGSGGSWGATIVDLKIKNS
jgi:DNA-nicking Smr family endonuclease